MVWTYPWYSHPHIHSNYIAFANNQPHTTLCLFFCSLLLQFFYSLEVLEDPLIPAKENLGFAKSVMPRRRKTSKEGDGYEEGQSSRASQDIRVPSQDVRYRQPPQHGGPPPPPNPHHPQQQGRGGPAQYPQGRGRGFQGAFQGPQRFSHNPPRPGRGSPFQQNPYSSQPYRQNPLPPRQYGQNSHSSKVFGGNPSSFQDFGPKPSSSQGFSQNVSSSQGLGQNPSSSQGLGQSRFPDLPQASSQQSTRPLKPEFVSPSDSTSESSVQSVERQLEKMSVDDSSVNAPSQPVVPLSSKEIRFPACPGKGSYGRRCMVKANHFFAQIAKKDLCHYDVSITPEVTSRVVNRAVIEELVKLYKDSHLGRRLPVYDGRKSLYTAAPLPFVSKEFSISLSEEGDGTAGARERPFKVVIKFAAKVDLHHLSEFLEGRQPDAPQEALQVLDIVLRELPTHSYFPVGRSFYSPNLGIKQSLGEGLQSMRGFYQSIRPTQMGLSLNIDMSSTAFIEPLPIIDFVAQLLNKDVVSKPLSDADRIKIKKALRGVKVEVTHRANMRRKYRISGLTSQPTRELTFSVDQQGTMKSVVQYFQETHGLIIQHTNLPCLQVGNPQRANYLPMEVCKIVEGQRYSKRLNDRQISKLLGVTCQHPRDRERDILQTVRLNSYGSDPYAVEFGIKIGSDLASVEARILPAPRLKYHDDSEENECTPHIGTWNMTNKKMVNGGVVNYWACLSFSPIINERTAKNFCSKLARMCNISGMEFKQEPVLPVYSFPPEQVETALRTVYKNKSNVLGRKELDLLIVILPDSNGSLYGELKRICETELGMVSQCCLSKHIRQPSTPYLANIALKINVKVGGRNTVLLDAMRLKIPLVSDCPTIIFGADVTHPNPGEDSSPSIAAVVASQDWPEVTKYAGLVSAQAHRQELIQDLFNQGQDPKRGLVNGGMIRELLISFRNKTGYKPQRIIFYRDGVSEGQFYQVLLHELHAIRKACDSLEQNYQPPVTFVVVQKRHHTRLFAANHNERGTTNSSGNILPGTVVDTKICHPTEFDFYLCSHAGIKGTSRPAHYHVLWDENNFSADELQSLTNNLCYTYARCTRSVSIVPPAYYAHLAAFRARFYMEPDTSDGGSLLGGVPGSRMTANTGLRNTRGQGSMDVRPLPAIKENVKRVMFYC